MKTSFFEKKPVSGAVNSSSKDLIEGKCYMILKLVKQDDNNFIPNEKLKPVKIADFSQITLTYVLLTILFCIVIFL